MAGLENVSLFLGICWLACGMAVWWRAATVHNEIGFTLSRAREEFCAARCTRVELELDHIGLALSRVPKLDPRPEFTLAFSFNTIADL